MASVNNFFIEDLPASVSVTQQLVWAQTSCTALVFCCQLLVLCTAPILLPKARSESLLKSLPCFLAGVPKRKLELPQRISRNASEGITSSHSSRHNWAIIIEIFFLALAGSTLLADALFHLLPEVLATSDESPVETDASANMTSHHHHHHHHRLALGMWCLIGMILVFAVESVVHSADKIAFISDKFVSLFRGSPGREHNSDDPRSPLHSCCINQQNTPGALSPGSDLARSVEASPFNGSACRGRHRQRSDLTDALSIDSTFRSPAGSVSDVVAAIDFQSFSNNMDQSPTTQGRASLEFTQPPVNDHSSFLSALEPHHRRVSSTSLSYSPLGGHAPDESSHEMMLHTPYHHHSHGHHDHGGGCCHGFAHLVVPDAVEMEDSDVDAKAMKKRHSVGWANLVAELFHNTLDGMAVGVAFLSASPVAGIATTICIFAHEVPSQIADFILLTRGGVRPGLAFVLNFAVAFGIHIGAVFAMLGTPQAFRAALQMMAAGNFICLSLSMIIPQLQDALASKEANQRNIQVPKLAIATFGLVLGVALMALLSLFEHEED